ncbi:MAG TPA: hypothetical protein VFE47_06415 [Tepidisphaeraceae bacterium]|jgi:hypothetical protein|nr:hypothetical protein [Tepidisphaeraceae bacterium]
MPQNIAERDWKILRDLHDELIERSRELSLEKVSRLLADSKKTSRERYVDIKELMKEEDEDFAVAIDDLRRSTALLKLAAMVYRKLLSDEELSRFSPETRVAVDRLMGAFRD